MKVFIDVDDTLFQTSNVMKGNTVAHILMAELEAPLFENVRETIEQFCKRGFDCFAVTKRGLILDDEVIITKQRLKETELVGKDSPARFIGLFSYANNKYEAIEKIYSAYYKTEVDKANTILIDDDVEQIINGAANGITAILFAPDLKNISQENQTSINKLNISVAHSWNDIKSIVLNKQLDEKVKE